MSVMFDVTRCLVVDPPSNAVWMNLRQVALVIESGGELLVFQLGDEEPFKLKPSVVSLQTMLKLVEGAQI